MSAADLFSALSKVPPQAYGDIATILQHALIAHDPADHLARMAAESAARIAFDAEMKREFPAPGTP